MLKNEFKEKMKQYLGDEYELYLKSLEEPNVRSIRMNTKYINSISFEELIDFNIKQIPNVDGGYYVESEEKFGFHPLHHAGAFYSQDPSAMLPALSTTIKNGSLILDLCASPGGKTLQLALQNLDGIVISNEIDFKRAKVLYSNVERFGLSNVIVTNNEAKDFLTNFKGCFDYVLVDAPCSGEGMFRKYPNAMDEWSLGEVELCHNRDIEILDIVQKLLKKDGVLIYSTCTFSKEENEDIISYMKETYDYETLDINENIKKNLREGFIPKTYRFYPFVNEGEGQFLAVLKKGSGEVNSPRMAKNKLVSKEFVDFCKSELNTSLNHIIVKDQIYYPVSNFDLTSLKVLNYGVKLGEVINKRFVPNHNMYKAFSHLFKTTLDIDYRDERVLKYLHGEEIFEDGLKGYGVLLINHIPLGGFKASNGVLKNHYPKGLRNF